MKTTENNDKNNNEFSIDTIIGFCRKNVRYISAGVIFLLLVIVLVKYTGKNNSPDTGSSTSVSAEVETATEDYELDAYPEINELVENYYAAYAKGKVKKLEKYATPISDIEKSYIKLFSDYVNSYQNISCYTKNGLTEDSHIVSVYYEMEFDGVETLAPGLDFFYVEKNEDGDYYINNVYSQYNLTNHEYELDEDIQALITQFEQEEDVVSLQTEVQSKYDEAVSSDKKLKKMVNTTIQDAIADWVANLTGEEKTAEDTEKKEDTEKAEDTEKKEDTEKTEDTEKKEDTETPAEEEKPTEETPAATSETVYATSKVNVREQPNETANILGEVEASTQLTRTGTTEDGWSMIDYNGTTAYVKSDYLTTDPNSIAPTVTYIPEGTVVRLAEAVVVRSGIGEDTDKVGTAFAGEELTVVMSYAEGWTKVNWNGKEGYVKTEVID